MISTVHKCGINTYILILSNFSLSSRERAIQMYLKILTTYSEKNLGHTELSTVFNAMCESPIYRRKIKAAAEIVPSYRGMKPKNFRGAFNTVWEAQRHWQKCILKMCTNYKRVGSHFEILATTHFAFLESYQLDNLSLYQTCSSSSYIWETMLQDKEVISGADWRLVSFIMVLKLYVLS